MFGIIQSVSLIVTAFAFLLALDFSRRPSDFFTIHQRLIVGLSMAGMMLSSGVTLAYKIDILPTEHVLRGFYFFSIIFISFLASSCMTTRSHRKHILHVGAIVIAVLCITSDLIVAGATIANDLPTREKGPLYIIFQLQVFWAVIELDVGTRGIIKSAISPALRNRARWIRLALTPFAAVAIILTVSMFFETPPVTAPIILGLFAAPATIFLLYALRADFLPSIARRSTPDALDHAQRLTTLRVLNECKGKVPDELFSELMLQVQSNTTHASDLVSWDAKGELLEHRELSKYCWSAELQKEGSKLIAKQNKTSRPQFYRQYWPHRSTSNVVSVKK